MQICIIVIESYIVYVPLSAMYSVFKQFREMCVKQSVYCK